VRVEKEAAEDKEQADADERDAPKHEEEWTTRANDGNLPKDCEATPKDAERNQEGVLCAQLDPAARLSRPEQAFAWV
jgi:hypothetical protein